MHIRSLASLAVVVVTLVVAGCSDGGSSRRTPPPPPPPPPPNTMAVDVDLASAEVVGGGASSGSATASFTVNLDDNTISGTVTLTGLTATEVNVNLGFAGENGPVLIALMQDSTTAWSVTDAAFTQADLDALNAGSLYVEVLTAAEPSGAVRAQAVVGDIEVYFALMSGSQEVPEVATNATATAAVTINSTTGALVIHVNTTDLDDAGSSHIHQALAGTNGGILVSLVQDGSLVSHWFAEDEVLDAAGMDAFTRGELYVNVHTPANAGGEVRGQIVPSGIGVVFTRLTGGDVVPPVGSANTGMAATTITTASQVITMHVNLMGLDEALFVQVNQAPVGQNGPLVFDLAQDAMALSRWSLTDQALSSAQDTALHNQGLYVTAQTPAFPSGEVRGQLQPDMSSPGSGSTFVVTAVSPANGGMVNALPATIVATFNRMLLPGNVSITSASLLASGGDGMFGDAQDLVVAIANVTASGSDLTIDLTGAINTDDVYQLTLDGSSNDPLTDDQGVVLDGDGDGSPGGDFVSTFTVEASMTTVTLTQIQTETFSVSCAVSGCHAGAAPAAGMNLSTGQAFNNIVGVPSFGNPLLDRVEPGDPDNSFLVQRIEGTVAPRMPLNQPALPNQQIQNIRNWILDGAQDN